MTKRRIKSATVERLALCRRGKTGLKVLFKSDGTAEVPTLMKGDMVKGEVLAVAYPLGHSDADGDFADSMEAIESMAHSFLREGAQLDIEHGGDVLSKDQAWVKESFIVQKGDERFAEWPAYDGSSVDVTGGWAVKLQIDDPALRKSYADGEWDGVSLFGSAAVEPVDVKAASERVAARMTEYAKENQMTKEQIEALVKETVAKAVEASASKPADTPEPKAEPEAEVEKAAPPKFEGDPLNAEDLAKYERELRKFEIQKAIDAGELSADQLAEMRKSLEPVAKADLEKAGVEEGDSDEVKALKLKLFKAQKGSNAPAQSDPDEDPLADSIALGQEIAKSWQSRDSHTSFSVIASKE